MAETVQYYLEQMIPELEDLENKGLFSSAEIKLIVKKRTNFEYALKRRIAKKIDFLRYIEYEMNLEELRKKRKQRLEATSGEFKQGISDHAGRRRILFIFKRAVNKFKGDVSLWMQYIDYVKGIRAENLLSGIFASALQFHPKKAVLWIMAASWEFETNANIGAARVLMQRALRLNPESKLLWHEYFKLELLYVEKIKARRRILGIEEETMTEEQKQVEQDMDMDQDDENMILLPTIIGEESDDENEEQKTVRNMENRTADALREGMKPILQGILATIVYDNAIQAVPEDLEFRTKFIDIYRTFTNTKKGREHVLETIRRDMGSRPDARAYLAARHLLAESAVSTNSPKYISYQDPAFVPAVQACIEEFNNAVKDIPTAEMFERYIDFLRDWQQKVIEENLKTYFSKMLERIFKMSIKQKTTSGRIYKAYTEYLLQSNREQAQKIIRQAIEVYPKESSLWILRIQLKSEGDKVRNLFKQALNENPSSPDLWEAYCDWIEKECKDGNVSDLEADRLYTDACQEASSLLPSLTSASADRDRVKDFVLSSYVEWAHETNGIEAARAAYKKIIRNFYPTYAFYKTCLDIENQHSSEDNQDIEYVYEMATRLDDHKEELYRLYVTHLRNQKKFKKADHVFWKASKEVPNFALETK